MHSARAVVNKNLSKRGTSAKGAPATYYNVQTGNQVACGGFRHNSDSIIAMNTADFGGGSTCGKSVTIIWNGISRTATIEDECPTCGPRGIDLSEGLFGSITSLGVGEISVDWFIGEPPAPSPTHKDPPPPPPTTTHHTTTTTTTHHTTHTTSSSSSSSWSSSQTSSSATPSQSGNVTIPTGANNIASLFEAVVQLGEVVVAGLN